MTEEHTHNHEEEAENQITLVDEQGNEELFDVLLTIDGQEEFGKNYVLVMPTSANENPDEEVEISAFSFTQNEDGTAGDLEQIPEDSEAEWAMIEDVFNQWQEEHQDEAE